MCEVGRDGWPRIIIRLFKKRENYEVVVVFYVEVTTFAIETKITARSYVNS